MGDIFVFRPKESNFGTIGLCGSLEPLSCEYEEIANGLAEVTLEHPLDRHGKWKYLRNDYIIGVDVPVRTTPEIDDDGLIVTNVETWKVAVTADKDARYVMSKEKDGKKLKKLNYNTKVTVLKRGTTDTKMLKVKTGKTSGWISEDALTYVSRTTINNTEASIETIVPAWETRMQLFRIYSVELTNGDTAVKVSAKHISYDLMYNITTYRDTTAHGLNYTATQILNNCICSHDFKISTAISGTHSGVQYADLDPITAILDPDNGLCSRWNAQFVRDNYELFLLNMGGINRGVVIEYGKDITGVTMTTDMSSVATRIRPIGENKNGGKLYLDTSKYPNACVNSTLRGQYAFDRIVTYTVSEAKESDNMTITQARDILLAKAKEKFSNGGDKPTISVSVDFENIENDERYKQYKNLSNVYLFDTVRVYYPPLGIDIATTVVRCIFDCLSGRMKTVEMGDLQSLTPTISSWQIGSIDGSKLVSGTVSGGSTSDNSITSSKIVDGAVIESKINNGAVSTNKILDGSITLEKLSQSLRDLLGI